MPRASARGLAVSLGVLLGLWGAQALAQGPQVQPLPAPPGAESPPPTQIIKQETTIIHQVLVPSALLQQAIEQALVGLFQPTVERTRTTAQTLQSGLGLTGELPRLVAPAVEMMGREGAKGAAALAVLMFVLRLLRYQWARLAGEGDTLMGVMADWLLGGVGALLCAPFLLLLLRLGIWAAQMVQGGPWGEFSAAAGLVVGQAAAAGAVTGAAALFLGLPLLALVGIFGGIVAVVLLAWGGLLVFLALVGPVVWVTGTLPELRWLRTWWLKAAVLLSLVPALATLVGTLLLRGMAPAPAGEVQATTVNLGTILPALSAGVVGVGLLLSLLGSIVELTVGHTLALAGRVLQGGRELVTLARGGAVAAGAAVGASALAGVPTLGAHLAGRLLSQAGDAGGLGAQDATVLRTALGVAAAENPALRGLERAVAGERGVALATALRREGVVTGAGANGVMGMAEALRVAGHLGTITRAAGVAAVAGGDPAQVAALVAALDRGQLTGPADIRKALGLPPVAPAALRDRLVGALRTAETPAARLLQRLLEGEQGERLVGALQRTGVLSEGAVTPEETERVTQQLLALAGAYAGDPGAAAALLTADPEKVAETVRQAREGTVSLSGEPEAVQQATRPLLGLPKAPVSVTPRMVARLAAGLPREMRPLLDGGRGAQVLEALVARGVVHPEGGGLPPEEAAAVTGALSALWQHFASVEERAQLLHAAPERVGAAVARLLGTDASLVSLERELRADLGLPPLTDAELVARDRVALERALLGAGLTTTQATLATPVPLVRALRAQGLLGGPEAPADPDTVARVAPAIQAFYQIAEKRQHLAALTTLADPAARLIARWLAEPSARSAVLDEWQWTVLQTSPALDEQDPFRPASPEVTGEPVEVLEAEPQETEIGFLEDTDDPPPRGRRRRRRS